MAYDGFVGGADYGFGECPYVLGCRWTELDVRSQVYCGLIRYNVFDSLSGRTYDWAIGFEVVPALH